MKKIRGKLRKDKVKATVKTSGYITERKEAERALRKSEEKYISITESVPLGIEEIDTNGIITFSNSAQHKMYGYAKGKLIGRSILDFVPGPEKEKLRKYLKFLVEKQPKPVPYFGKKITKKGKIIDVQVSWNYKRDKEGRVIGFNSVITDITKRKKAEEKLLQQAVFMKNNPAPVLRMGYDGKIIEINPAAKKLFKKDLVGISIHNIFSYISKSVIASLLMVDTFQFEQRIGKETFSFILNRDEPTHSYCFYGSEVTEREKSAEMLKEQNKDLLRKSMDLTELGGQLEDRNYELESAIKSINKQNKDLVKTSMALTELRGQLEDKNYELQQANKEILSLMEARTDFINKAAHDLRTPITPILVLLPTIKKRIKDIGVLFDLKVIERNANYLKNIADNLISYLKSNTQKYDYNFKKTDIRELIEDVLITYREVFKQRKISIIKKFSGNLPLIKLDGLKITEVLQNIVSNSIKFMPRVGKLTISVKKMDNFINIRFKDTGIGIKKENLEEIFIEFFKADVSRHTAGEGLGLSICKGIIEDHHGKIWAESKGLGKGTTVSFNIPITQKKVKLYEKQTEEK
ncbi:MAG: PAS domain S-box protein [Nanoarchaeota archaeon]|nr:PAS domain S-box protein [Nanoarchaeota archaeon]